LKNRFCSLSDRMGAGLAGVPPAGVTFCVIVSPPQEA
jgi:hypothetical protein